MFIKYFYINRKQWLSGIVLVVFPTVKTLNKYTFNNKIKDKDMKNTLFVFFCAVILSGLFIVGCNKDTTAPELTDTDFLKQAVTSSDSLADFLDSEDISLNDGDVKDFDYDDYGTLKTSAAITPLRWGRKIDNIIKVVNVEFFDSIAIATVYKTITGKFIVKGINTNGDTIKVEKPFTTNTERKIRFRKIANYADPRKNWIPVAMTLVVGKTTNTTFGISQLEVFSSFDTVTVTNPLTYWFRMAPWRGGISILKPGDSVMVRLTVTSPEDSAEYAVIRHGAFNKFYNKRIRNHMTLVSQTGSAGAYTRVYEKKFIAHLPMGHAYGRFHALIDVMSYNSINDDTAPLMNMFWGAPYVVRRW